MITLTGRQYLDLLRSGKKPQEKIKIKGDLSIGFSTNIEEILIDNLTITGNLFINDTLGENLPLNLSVGGMIFMTGSAVKYLRKDTKIKGKGYHPFHVFFNNECFTREQFNHKIGENNFAQIYFLREKIITLRKLIEIPELFDEVYYSHKNEIISLLSKI